MKRDCVAGHTTLTTKLFVLVLTTTLFFSGCRRVHEKVVQSYPDGTPMLVYLYKGSEKNPTRVGERMFYNDGTLQFEKKFSGKPEQPDGIWNYYFDNGQLFASGDFSHNHEYGSNWQFFNRNGGAYYDAKLDSVYVNDMGMFGTPSTVVFCSGANQDVIQFFSNFTVRSTERLTNGVRNGHIIFYYPGGKMQTEANFVNGVEEGEHIVYHENGVPYYRGMYSEGKRVGIWEFYDEDGELVETKEF